MSHSGVAWRFIYDSADPIVHYGVGGESKSSHVAHQSRLMLACSGHIFVRAWRLNAQNI
jgi:hypothetical protein